MRFDKLVEMVKSVGREKLEERHHSERYARGATRRISGRYRPGIKLAQEAQETEEPAKEKTEVNFEPQLNSQIAQNR